MFAENPDEINIDYRALHADLQQGGELAVAAEDFLRNLGRASFMKMLEAASVDAKTKLYTQDSLEKDVLEILANSEQFGLLIVTDLVKFKIINDMFGQEFGDTVIEASAKGLISVVSKRRQDAIYVFEDDQDTIAKGDSFRIGGDEFAVLLRNSDPFEKTDIEKIVRRKVLGILSHRPLVEKLEDKAISGFGVRASAVILDSTVHTSFKDVLRDADPKQRTLCEYHLMHDDSHLAIKKIQ